jgi:hypothetical protein
MLQFVVFAWIDAVAPSPAGVEVSPGLEFDDQIAPREQMAIRKSFERVLPIACEPPPCVHDCREGERSVGVTIGGHSRDYALRWVATDPRLDAPLLLESSCELCSLVEVEAQLAADLAGLCASMDGLDGAPGRVRVSSEPARAWVRVDGRRAGHTPWVGEIEAGKHELRVGARGHGPQTRTLQIFAGIELREHFELAASARARPAWPGWTSLGLGVALGIAGTALIVAHGKEWQGRCSGPDIDTSGDCRFVYRTRPLGVALAAVGAGSFATGVGLIVWSQGAGQAAGQGAGLTWRGRF